MFPNFKAKISFLNASLLNSSSLEISSLNYTCGGSYNKTFVNNFLNRSKFFLNNICFISSLGSFNFFLNIKAKSSIKVSFIIYSSAKFFSTNKTDNSALNCNANQQISNNVLSISPIAGIGNQANLVTSTFEIQQVIL